MATRSMPFWPRPATTSGSSWPGSGLCAPFSGRLSWSGITRAAPPPHPPERPNSLFHRRRAMQQNDIQATVTRILEQVAKIDPAAVARDTRLREDLGVDSLTLIEVAVAAEDAFGVPLPDEDLERFQTVGNIIDYVRRARVAA